MEQSIILSKDISEINHNGVVEKDEIFWCCTCGHSLFFLMADGPRCQLCGLDVKINEE